ncbi:MAG: alpha/beta hydrolase [Phycisphaerae bacterium]|mgnify:CR=1 FL=1|nr:alpha/beta hydrolase [Phycisphaerae bacterium]
MLSALAGLAVLIAVATTLVVGLYVWTIAREALHPPQGGAAWALARHLPTTPSEMGLSFRSFTVDCNGFGMPVWEIDVGASGLRSDGPSVVLVHGWGRSRIDSLNRLPPFLDVAGRLYLVDLRGHGDAGGRTTLGSREADDLAALLATLAPAPIVLVGHSLGAAACIRCAALSSAAERIAGVIAIAPYDTVATPIAARLAARELPRGALLALASALLKLRGIAFHSTLNAARALRCPLLVVQGERDRISPPADARSIAEAASGQYVSMPEAEHADHQTREPERFALCVQQFVRSAVREPHRAAGSGAPSNDNGPREDSRGPFVVDQR